jgi:pimeloyl-ACP methyl ester carboxylesterase
VWGASNLGQLSKPADLTNVVAISAGASHSLVLCSDGTVKSWGSPMYGQENVPSGLTNAIAISAGAYHSMALIKGDLDPFSSDTDNDGLLDGWEVQNKTNPFDTDTDGDGLTDYWENKYNFDPFDYTDASEDNDDDGLWNLTEQKWGTDPHNSDTDFDGLTDDVECSSPFWTSPLEPDSDFDGLGDLWEVENGLWPHNPTGDNGVSGDPDNDGLTNLEEMAIETHPNKWDTDGDLLPDGWEVKHELDPLAENNIHTDFDNDDLDLFDEYRYGTDPTKQDTDGDGAKDGDEVPHSPGSNPNDASDYANKTNCVTMWLTVGDPSGSHSERWKFDVFEESTPRKSVYHHVNDKWGTVSSNGYSLVKGKSYTYEINWIDTAPDKEKDYDWQALINGSFAAGIRDGIENTGQFIVRNPDNSLLTEFGGESGVTTENDAAGKVGEIIIPLTKISPDYDHSGVVGDAGDANTNGVYDATGLVVSVNTNFLYRMELDVLPCAMTYGYVELSAVKTGSGDVKVWATDVQYPWDLLLNTVGSEVMTKEWTLSDSFSANDILDNIYVEGINASSYSGDISLMLKFTYSDTLDTLCTVVTQKITVVELQEDTDVDSDNDDKYKTPEMDEDEEEVQRSGSIGKIAKVYRGDLDGDGVPNIEDMDHGGQFVPLVVKGFLSTTKFKFDIPSNIRIWTKNGNSDERINSFTRFGGDLIESGYEYSYTDLFSGGLLILDQLFGKELYIEGLESGRQDIVCEYILADNIHYTEIITASVIDCSLLPNYDRDDKIGTDDLFRYSTNQVYRFWINDDDDEEDIATKTSDNHGQTFSDNDNSIVDGRCDVIDFFPVHLDIHDAIDVFGYDNTKYILRNAKSDLKFVYSDLTINNVKNYLTSDDAMYGLNFDSQFNNATSLTITDAGYELSIEFLLKILCNEDKGVILIEGCDKNSAPLVLEVRSATDELLFSTILNIDISNIEDMYHWVNLRDVCGDNEDDDTDNHLDESSNGKNIVFVHGYNVNEYAARAWSSEMFKRLYQSGSNAKFTSVAWYGDKWQLSAPLVPWVVTPDFYNSVEHAFKTAKSLKDVVNSLGGTENIILSHSLGAMLVSSAIKDYNLDYSKFIMLDGAVSIEAFDASIADNPNIVGLDFVDYPSRVWASKWHQLFDSSDSRSTLTWKGRFSGMANVYNFFSSTEDVLAKSNGTIPINLLKMKQNAWTNGEMLKGRLATGWAPMNREGGWDFNTYYDTNVVNYIEYDEMGNPTTNWHDITLPPEDAANISTNSLKEHTFFYRFDDEDDICGVNGSAFVANRTNHCELLANGIPALSDAAGGTKMASWSNDNNIDMSTECRRGSGKYSQGDWPRDENKWWHGDVKDVAYPYNYKVYKKIVTEGKLDD